MGQRKELQAAGGFLEETVEGFRVDGAFFRDCLLYTSDAADE